MSEVFLSPAELEKRWNGIANQGTLANWRNRGKGPAFMKIGGQVIYPLSQVEKWERERTFSQSKEHKEYVRREKLARKGENQ